MVYEELILRPIRDTIHTPLPLKQKDEALIYAKVSPTPAY